MWEDLAVTLNGRRHLSLSLPVALSLSLTPPSLSHSPPSLFLALSLSLSLIIVPGEGLGAPHVEHEPQHIERRGLDVAAPRPAALLEELGDEAGEAARGGGFDDRVEAVARGVLEELLPGAAEVGEEGGEAGDEEDVAAAPVGLDDDRGEDLAGAGDDLGAAVLDLGRVRGWSVERGGWSVEGRG